MTFSFGKTLSSKDSSMDNREQSQRKMQQSLDLKKLLRQYPVATDFSFGGIAGFIAGSLVAPVEYLKVVSESTKRQELKKTLKSQATRKNMAKSVFPFSFTFGAVCALQFCVNHRIGEIYGKPAGLVASALTGTFFLTAADHIMFRRHTKTTTTYQTLKELFNLRKTALWTGFTPMLGRQAIFILSVLHLGPLLGKALGGKQKESIAWSSIGRVITGLVTTLLSQPFDTTARSMQKSLLQNQGVKPKVFQSVKALHQEYRQNKANNKHYMHPLFYGAVPRIALATFGGVIAGGIYDYLKQKLLTQSELQNSQMMN